MMSLGSKNVRFLARMGSRGVLGQALTDLSLDGGDFFAVSADLGRASGFERLMKRRPERVVNVGIAEQNLIGVAAGLASDGTPVFASSWAAFASLRCADQIRNFLGYMRRNVKLIGMDSGLVQAKSSYSHCCPQDIAYLRTVPGLTILSPSDGVSIYQAVRAAFRQEGPFYIRLTGGAPLPAVYQDARDGFQIGRAIETARGEDVALIACGAVLAEAVKAAGALREDGISAGVWDMHTVKPLDVQALSGLLSRRLLVTVEEHVVLGGLGGAVAEFLAPLREKPPLLILGAGDRPPLPGTYRYAMEQAGLTGERIARSVRGALRTPRAE